MKMWSATMFASLALVPSSAGHPPQQSPMTAAAATTNAQDEFKKLKTLAGTWKGRGPDGAVRVTFRVTSGGSALLQEMTPEGRASDPSNGDDDPVTMIYVDGDKLTLVMYCDTGKNRPRMLGTRSADGTRLEFAMVDFGGDRTNGIMDRATFSIADASHHTESWDYLTPGGQRMHAQLELTRVQ